MKSKKIDRVWDKIVNVYAVAIDASPLREILLPAYCDDFPIAIFFAETFNSLTFVVVPLGRRYLSDFCARRFVRMPSPRIVPTSPRIEASAGAEAVSFKTGALMSINQLQYLAKRRIVLLYVDAHSFSGTRLRKCEPNPCVLRAAQHVMRFDSIAMWCRHGQAAWKFSWIAPDKAVRLPGFRASRDPA